VQDVPSLFAKRAQGAGAQYGHEELKSSAIQATKKPAAGACGLLLSLKLNCSPSVARLCETFA
jgi:hypothetical protein